MKFNIIVTRKKIMHGENGMGRGVRDLVTYSWKLVTDKISSLNNTITC